MLAECEMDVAGKCFLEGYNSGQVMSRTEGAGFKASFLMADLLIFFITVHPLGFPLGERPAQYLLSVIALMLPAALIWPRTALIFQIPPEWTQKGNVTPQAQWAKC